MQEAVLVEGLSKKYFRASPGRPQTFQELFARGTGKALRQEAFWALHDVSFNVSSGRMMGVIGRNGAGKSTLLRLVGGVGRLDGGRIITRGRIGALIDLGAGFHPDLTGRENIHINGVISGLTRKEVLGNFDSIVGFSELEEFIDNPLRTYSLGMQMRLAFSVAIHTRPSILLIDEVLAVGDAAFQKKCLDQIARFKAQGCAILLVTHNTDLVSDLCDDALWLSHGRVMAHGDARMVVNRYLDEMRLETQRRTEKAGRPGSSAATGNGLILNENRFGSLEMEITAVKLLNHQGHVVDELPGGQPLSIQVEYRAPQPIPSPIFGITISTEDGSVCVNVSTETAGIIPPKIGEAGRVTLSIERLDLNGGAYFVDVGVYEHQWAYAYDYHWHVYPLKISSSQGSTGVLNPPHHWELASPRGE